MYLLLVVKPSAFLSSRCVTRLRGISCHGHWTTDIYLQTSLSCVLATHSINEYDDDDDVIILCLTMQSYYECIQYWGCVSLVCLLSSFVVIHPVWMKIHIVRWLIYVLIIRRQWRRQLWGTATRVPPTFSENSFSAQFADPHKLVHNSRQLQRQVADSVPQSVYTALSSTHSSSPPAAPTKYTVESLLQPETQNVLRFSIFFTKKRVFNISFNLPTFF